MKKILKTLYVGCIVLALAVPALGMSFWMSKEPVGNQELAPFPSLLENGSLNINWLADFGSWFDSHYAFRPWLISANSWLYTTIGHSSPIDSVVLGKNDWLYYQDTLNDYQGLDLLSEAEIQAIVHNLALMNQSLEAVNIQFVFAAAPNKNTIYPENMPAAYIKGEQSNLDHLKAALAASDITFVDWSQSMLENKEENIYYARDSHWNQLGALFAYNQLMDSLGLEHPDFLNYTPSQTQHTGDLDAMLMPKLTKPELERSYQDWFTYQSNTDDYMADWIETENLQGEGTVFMFRDSFGTNLIPYLAQSYAHGYFSRLVPYNFYQAISLKPEVIVVEKAERFIPTLLEKAAFIPLTYYKGMQAKSQSSDSEILLKTSGDFVYVHGTVDSDLISANTQIYINMLDVNDEPVKASDVFYLSDRDHSANRFGVYIPKDDLENIGKLEIIIYNTNEQAMISTAQVKKEFE